MAGISKNQLLFLAKVSSAVSLIDLFTPEQEEL